MGARTKSVFQEEMQKTILAALSRKGCFKSIVFHGGTALRLFHGNPRFSEDIDLVLKDGIGSFDLAPYSSSIGSLCRDSFPFLETVEVRSQKIGPDLQRYILKASSIDQQQNLKVHIELATIPSYFNGPRILDLPPIQPVIMVEEPFEILADKAKALAFRPYLKGRDLWDIYFLSKERSVVLDRDLVLRKIMDYKEPVQQLGDRLDEVRRRIEMDGRTVLASELERFLPKNVLESYSDHYEDILKCAIEIISDLKGNMEVKGHESR